MLFVLIVLVLAVVGYVLVVPALHGRGAAAPKPAASSAPAPSAAAGGPGQASAAPSTATPVATQVPAGAVNIYDWLPFTQQDLAAAAAVVVRFSVDYDSFTSTESSASYIAKMNGLVTASVAASLQNAYTAPGVSALRVGQRQTATATASIVSLRGFGPSSLLFIVNISQRLVSLSKTTNSSTQYAVTLTGSGSSWQVSDIELAKLGNN